MICAACIDGGLGIIGLNEAVPSNFMMRFPIGKLRSPWDRAGPMAAPPACRLLRPSAWRCCSFSARSDALPPPPSWRRLQRRHRLLDFASRFCLSPAQWHLVATLVLCESLVLLGIRRLSGPSMRATSAFNSARVSSCVHKLIAYVSRVRLIFVPSSADVASLTSPAGLAQLQNLQEQRPSAFKCRLRKSLICEIRGSSAAIHHEIVR